MSVIEMLRQLSLRTHVYNENNMRRQAAVTLLFVLSALSGCKSGKNALIVLDHQWAVKQAQTDCQSRQREGMPPCTADPAIMIRDLEAQTAAAFSSNASCKGMTLVTLNSSEDASQLDSRQTWWLFLELLRSNNMPNELRYTVSQSEDPRRPGSATGQGEPSSIASEFCSFVRQGGLVE